MIVASLFTIAFVSIALFYYLDRTAKLRRREQSERLERQKQYFNQLMERRRKDDNESGDEEGKPINI